MPDDPVSFPLTSTNRTNNRDHKASAKKGEGQQGRKRSVVFSPTSIIVTAGMPLPEPSTAGSAPRVEASRPRKGIFRFFACLGGS